LLPNFHLTILSFIQDATFGVREPKYGTIKIRLRLELESERTLLLSNFCLPLSVHVNQESKTEFEVLRQTVEGRVDPEVLSLVSVCLIRFSTSMRDNYNHLSISCYSSLHRAP